MTADISSEHGNKSKLSKACLFFQERIVRCLLLLSVLCLAGCEGNKSESPCALSLLGHGWVAWKGKVKPSPDPYSSPSFRALLKAVKEEQQNGAQGGRNWSPGASKIDKLQAVHPSHKGCVSHGNEHRCCNVPPCSLVTVTGPSSGPDYSQAEEVSQPPSKLRQQVLPQRCLLWL